MKFTVYEYVITPEHGENDGKPYKGSFTLREGANTDIVDELDAMKVEEYDDTPIEREVVTSKGKFIRSEDL